MSEMKIKVPDGMLKAAEDAITSDPNSNGLYLALEAALRWQRENAPVPTQEQIEQMYQSHREDGSLWNRFGSSTNPAFICFAWIRRMYDAINIEPSKCPHRWCAKIEDSTSERVVFCENCGWVYSRDSLESLRRGRENKTP